MRYFYGMYKTAEIRQQAVDDSEMSLTFRILWGEYMFLLGISSYELSKSVPEKFKGSIPTIEEIEAELIDTASDSEDDEGGEKA